MYFSKEEYPVENGHDGQGWSKLQKCLEVSSTLCGYNIFSNGGRSSHSLSGKNHYRVFKCTHGVIYRNDIQNRISQQYINMSATYD